MAKLNIYSIADKKREHLLFQLSEHDLNLLVEELNVLKNISSIVITPYQDTRIFNNHIEILLSSIRKRIARKEVKFRYDQEYLQLKKIMKLLEYGLSFNGLYLMGE